jgi:hypothetical protein
MRGRITTGLVPQSDLEQYVSLGHAIPAAPNRSGADVAYCPKSHRTEIQLEIRFSTRNSSHNRFKLEFRSTKLQNSPDRSC